MVLVDGHDSGWMTKFRSAIVDDDDDDESNNKIDKLSFVHLNLSFVPWKEMLHHIRPDYRNQHYYHGQTTMFVTTTSSNSSSPRQKRRNHRQKKRWKSIEVVDCRKVESGLTHLLLAQLHIEHIYISSRHNTLSRQFGQIIGLGLIESKYLTKVHLSSCHWSEEAMKEIVQGLQSTCALEELNLSFTTWNHHNHNRNHHPAGGVGGGEINNEEEGNGNNDHDDNDELRILEHFASGLSQNTTIKVLKLNLCRLSDNQIAYLIKFGLMNHPCLEELCLGGNTLQQHSMEAISTMLLLSADSGGLDGRSSSSCKIRTLDISNPLNHHHSINQNSDDPLPQQHYHQPILFRSLAQQQQQQQNLVPPQLSSSSSSSSLRVLNLASNKLIDDHIDELILAIKQSGIATLDLKSNQITDVGITKLAKDLPPKLERLWLQGNPFGIVGAQSLLNTIQKSHGHMIDLRIPTYNTLSPVPTLMKIQKSIRYYEALNRGGRQIILHQNKPVPLGLWPFILERVNKLNFENGYDFYDNLKLEVHYTLLHEGPVLFS